MNSKNIKNGARQRAGGKKKMNPALKFAFIVILIVTTFVIVAAAGVMGYVSNRMVVPVKIPGHYLDPNAKGGGGAITKKDKIISKVPQLTSFVIICTDESDMLADVSIVGVFDSVTHKLSLLSVPRDIMVSMPKELLQRLNAANIYPPEYMKLTEVHSYARDFGVYAMKTQIERELGVTLDYYVKIDIDGFRKVVDALGGVDMELTRNYYYNDPDQKLRINLKKGYQHLDGAKSEQLVRYRHDYAGGDLKRIEVQQEWMKALYEQCLTRSNIIDNAPAVLRSIMESVKTDMPLTQASKYIVFLKDMKPSDIQFYKFKHEPDSFRGPNGLSYIRLDKEELKEIVDRMFYGVKDEEAVPPPNSKELKISVLNGSGVAGLARLTSETLKIRGYNVTVVGDYNGAKNVKDRIFVKYEGFGEDLLRLFDNGEIIVDKDKVSKGCDITIVLGTANKADNAR